MSSSWQQVTIKDIAVVDWGNTNLTKKAFVPDGPYLGVSAAGCDGRMEHAEHKKNTPVLSAIGAQCGRMFLPQEDFTAIKNTITLTPLEGVTDPVFLYYLLTFVELPQRGAGQPFISKGDIQKFPVPLPPLEEQQRIVAVLDEAFEGLARARAHAKANLQNTRELFEASLSGALNMSAADWEVLPLGDAFTTSTGSTPPKSQKELYGDAVSFVKPPELLNQEIGETADGLSKQGEQVARIAPAGSVLVSCIGILGKVGLAETDVAFNQQINSIHPNRSKALPEFMFYQAYSSSFRRQLEALAGGTTVPIVNKSRFNSLKIALPPLDVQRHLVARFQKIDQETKELQEAYRQKLQDLDDLRQSILQKAFAGELT